MPARQMPTILIAEGNEANRDALARHLERRHYTVLQAVDGLQAVSIARAARPDLIVMDLGLPVIDGWEATAQLKQSTETRDIPIIVLTAHAMASVRDHARAAGGDDFDTRPAQFARLVENMERMLPKKSDP